MKTELLNNTNDDLMIANTARVSFNNWNDELDLSLNAKGNKKDPTLINYLATHKHISPFFHIRFTFEFAHNEIDLLAITDPTMLMGMVYRKDSYTITVRTSFYGWVRLAYSVLLSPSASIKVQKTLQHYAPYAYDAYFDNTYFDNIYNKPEDLSVDVDDPLFQDASIRITDALPVVRQMFTHRMFATNEVSRRYVSTEPSLHFHKQWRSKPEESIKQGSGALVDPKTQVMADRVYGIAMDAGVNGYMNLLDLGVAPEQARYILPQAMKTDVIFTGSIQAWKDVISKRIYSGAQQEVRDLAYDIQHHLASSSKFNKYFKE